MGLLGITMKLLMFLFIIVSEFI